MRLQPPPIRLDHLGRELPHVDDDWLFDIGADGNTLIIRMVDEGATHDPVSLDSVHSSSLCTTIGKDIAHRFDIDRSRGTEHGFLALNQLKQAAVVFALARCRPRGERARAV